MNIFLVAPMGSGKDATAAFLNGYTRLALGDEIRVLAKNLKVNGVAAARLHLSRLMTVPDDADVKLAEFQRIQSKDSKSRKLLQELGTWAREHYDYVWIDVVAHKIRPGRNHCITDVRRLVEFQSFPGFKSVWIQSSKENRIKRMISRDGAYDPAWENAKSEQEIQMLKPMCDYALTNDGTLDDLRESVERMLAYFEWEQTN